MTVSMEHRDHRKNSWDSKMSISTVSTGTRNFRRSPSSILSSDSDIRFTRKKLTSQTRCGCYIIALFLTFLLLAGAAVYLGYTYFLPQYPNEQVYRATFKVIEGDTFSPEMADPNTRQFKDISRDYRERLNLLFKRSPIGHGYVGSDVLALDGTEGKDLIIHFIIRIDPTYINIKADNLEEILADEISVEESLFFRNLTIDSKSLEVRSTDVLPQVATTLATTLETFAPTPRAEPVRKCAPIQLKYCNNLKYNVTSYPNIFEHRHIKDVRDDVISFRELVDAECYRYAYDFVCQVLQPNCRKNVTEDKLVLPCRNFCKDFIAGCGSRLSDKFKEFLDCNRFPEYTGEGTCLTKPGCVEELQARALSPRICDGTLDCQDMSDEKSCSYCAKNHLHCGTTRICIPANKRCDGKQDCPDGSDERACLRLASSVAELQETPVTTSHVTRYNPEGYLIFNEKGDMGKLCTENINKTLSSNSSHEVLRSVAKSLCNTLTYNHVLKVQIEKDNEANVSYVKIQDPGAADIKLVRSKCPSKQVLKVSCMDFDCGLQNNYNPLMPKPLPKMATHGDWPWHAALYKEDVHICDGTLVSADWLATTTSCFQGQPKAEWTARFGTVRLTSTAPWEQERRIVGMVKSPIEGSNVALIKLDQPVVFNDFVRPICLPNVHVILTKADQCNALGWARNRDQLQRVQVKVAEMQKCDNVSISNINSICTETYYGQNDCNEEEFAGSPMVCQLSNNPKWTLIGITNWRIACAKNGMERPRQYDKIMSNVKWIHDTIYDNNNAT